MYCKKLKVPQFSGGFRGIVDVCKKLKVPLFKGDLGGS
jgi:hypothetical protein